MGSTDIDQPVLVAGAGPTGMTAALALHARGVPAAILEADSEDRDRAGSRAIYVHGSTLKTFDRVSPGLGKKQVEEGLVWPTRRTLWRGKEVFKRTYDNPGGDGEFPHFTSIPQESTEAYMHDALEEAGIPIHWDAGVESVESTPDGVHVETADGREWEAPYLIGADGGGSRVRKEIGAEFEGDQSENSFVIVDVDLHTDSIRNEPLPFERMFHYDDPAANGRNVMLVPFSGGWRLDIQCLGDDDPEEVSGEETLKEIIASVMGEEYTDNIKWTSTYKFLQVIADRFVDEHRRVLLAGEAAHLLAPFGARGMNSCVADADAAASAITVALQARTDGVARHEVDLYESQRRDAAEYNVWAAGEALKYLQGEDPVTVLRKEVSASLADYFEPAGEYLDDAPYGPHEAPPSAASGNY
ncbi:FAD-dependent monooxygenase [Halobellus sp. GM3]|uniref:FAD-dependent monooxygenase n=1 Tax=Halobellus sp. GM3 TaxID=3458410 RepID=UPI00403D62F4